MIKQKYCLVTGASGGIGGEIAKALSKEGYSVIIQGRNLTKLNALKHSIDGDVHILTGDLSDKQQRKALMQKAFEIGSIELLVNAAGISQFSGFESLDESQMSQLININLTVPMLLTQSFIGAANDAEKSGAVGQNNEVVDVSIVNVGSAFGYIGYPGFSGYCASKFGLRGFTESLAREFSDTRFKFLYYAPRATETAINTQSVNKMNAALGNTVDTPLFVAKQFITFLKSNQREKVLGWPEKLFVRINSLLPKIVDNAIHSKLKTIKRFMPA